MTDITDILETANRIRSGAEYFMEFTPKSSWDAEIIARNARLRGKKLLLTVSFDTTDISLDVRVYDPRGGGMTPDRALPEEDCTFEPCSDGIICRAGKQFGRIRGKLIYKIPQGACRVSFYHSSDTVSGGLGEMRFSVTIEGL